METILSLYYALTTLDYTTLSDPSVLWVLYAILFAILFLENGLLPAAFLPGDSLLFITGILISVDIFHFGWLNFILITGAALGTWLGYFQGRWLGSTRVVKNWLDHLPLKYHQRAQWLFHQYGLAALFGGRFIPFVRTLLPVLAGLSGLQSVRFHLYNWISAALWIFLITTLGYIFGLSPIFKTYEKEFMLLFMLIPVVLLLLGLIISIWFVIKRWLLKKKLAARQNDDIEIEDNKKG